MVVEEAAKTDASLRADLETREAAAIERETQERKAREAAKRERLQAALEEGEAATEEEPTAKKAKKSKKSKKDKKALQLGSKASGGLSFEVDE